MGKIQHVPNAEKASDSHIVTKSQVQSMAVVPNLSPQVSPTEHVLGTFLRKKIVLMNTKPLTLI